MNPDEIPWQIGLPVAGVLWAWLAVSWHLRRSKRGGRA